MLRQTAVQPQQQALADSQVRNTAPVSSKSKAAALVLTFFLGCWGAHWFYLNQTKKAAVMLCIGFFGLFLFFPLLVTGLWSLVDFIMMLCMSDEEFNRKYNTL